MQDQLRKDIWDKLVPLSAFIGSVAVPLAIAFVGNNYSASIKESENRVKYVELAISQLRSPPKPETEALRDWAIELLNAQSPVKLSVAAQQQLRQHRVTGTDGGGSGSDVGGDAGDGPRRSRINPRVN